MPPNLLLVPLVIYGTARLLHAAWTGALPLRFSVVREADHPAWFVFNLALLAAAVGLGWMMLLHGLTLHVAFGN